MAFHVADCCRFVRPWLGNVDRVEFSDFRRILSDSFDARAVISDDGRRRLICLEIK